MSLFLQDLTASATTTRSLPSARPSSAPPWPQEPRPPAPTRLPIRKWALTPTRPLTVKDNENNTAIDTGPATVNFFWRGRTPGYWKNHPKEWPKFSIVNYKGVTVSITNSTLVTNVFNVPQSLLTCKQGSCILDLNGDKKADTLLVALAYQGGSDLRGSAQILLRAAVAGLLNEQYFGAAYPAYNSPSELVSAVNQALASLTRATMIDLANKLDYWNNGVH